MAIATRTKSVFDGIPEAPPDPIISLTSAYQSDPAEVKLNLGVGAYRTDEGKPYILPVVKDVERLLLEEPDTNHEYLGIDGLKDFKDATAKLILGEDCAALREGRVVTVQALSGTGSLRVGMEFLALYYRPGAKVYIPAPTWPNHQNIVPRSGLGQAAKYRYFDSETKGVDFAGMMEDLNNAPEGSVVILHPCAHNPTGADLRYDQWQELLELFKVKHHLPFFDSAYQGFATGDLRKDRFAVELFAKADMEMFISQSYAKNMGLYGERVGALSIVVSDKSLTDSVLGQLKRVIRPMYSSPPAYGAKIAARIIRDPALFDKWNEEMKIMSGRIIEMRRRLVEALERVGAPGDWKFIQKQIGMFSYSGLTTAQVDFLREKYHIYMMRDGRISMAGLTSSKVDYLANAINEAIRHAPKSHL
mmetsp:Transcript_7345/g.22394  ORF Transcript_7345/g.22394 Transcript_7345/m.22394 type:complete len:418 (+) Transcript_7345:61-1314(+)